MICFVGSHQRFIQYLQSHSLVDIKDVVNVRGNESIYKVRGLEFSEIIYDSDVGLTMENSRLLHSRYKKQAEKKYLQFREINYEGRKTKTFLVSSTSFDRLNEDIAEIKWYSAWRSYCLFPFVQTIWDKNCLNEINDKIDELMNERASQSEGQQTNERENN
jgi:hypothetical protein